MKKRVFSFVLCMALLLANMGGISNGFFVEAKESEKDSVTVIACSDYQQPNGNASGSTIVNSILSQIEAAGYDKADGFLAMGDYDYEYVETTEGIESLKGTVQSTYPNLADDKMVFVQGNHDVAGSEGLSASGANDTEDYGVYVIHHDDFPWGGGEADAVQNIAADLADYLQDKVDKGNKQPIFVVSHLPLHYSTRTRNGGDAKYAQYLFEVINKHANEGQTIIYLFGHNHNSWGYDDYLGTGSVYLKKGDSIYIAKPESQTAVPTEYELAFTYMNAGYVGYNYSETTGADKTLTMTVFEIRDDLVTVERYSASGLHNMKSRGIWANNSLQVDSKEQYGADDSYLQKEYKSPQAIVGDMTEVGSVRVISSEFSDVAVIERMAAKDETVHSAYISYDVETTGYTKGQLAIVHVTFPEDSDFDLSKPIFLIEKESGAMTTCVTSNGQLKFETNNLGDFELAQYKAVSSATTEQTIYRYVSTRNQFTDGKKYMIVSANAAGDACAMKNVNGEEITKAEVEIKSDLHGFYIETTDTSIIWKYILTDPRYSRGVGDLQNQFTNRYLYAGEGSLPLAKENAELDHTYWNISGSLYMYTYQNWDTRSGTRWCLKFDKNFILDTANYTTNQVYVFEEETVFQENAVSLDSTGGRVFVNATTSSDTGSKLIFSHKDGTMEVVDITVSMLRDKDGDAINTGVIGTQRGLQVYYDDVIIYDDYTLQVCHENGFNYLDVSEYRSGDTYTYPEERGYVFAGWYEDAVFTEPLGIDVKDGYAYAKFVNAEVLEAKYQIAADTTTDSKDTNLRLTTTVDSLLYKEVGFVLHANGKDSKPCVSDTVYETIIGKVDDVYKTYYPHEEFDSVSKYFMTFTVAHIPNSEFEKDITVKPRWTTLDGTIVYGKERVVNISENVAEEPVFYNGITFEGVKTGIALFDVHDGFSAVTVASYTDEEINVKSYDLGERGLKLTPSGTSYYPSMTLKYENVPAGTIISFMVYIDTYVTGSKWWIESKQGSNAGDFVPTGVTNSTSRSEGYEVNQWIEVSYTLQSDVPNGHYLFFNMDNGGEELVETGATIYIDNVKLTTPMETE